ncbi:MAG: tryptophan synthase subunit alpha [Labilithrix sp.]|nr:tryptophan synthase subunit alpha [Labilithrix sp.]MBX3225333.1 tryptophan synthase subunit alpha [Labilithrix sp.]
MGRIEEAFARGAAEKRKALVTYLCVGDPDGDASIDLALACADEGADILELGCPFSDPSADGVAIARASQRALGRGGGLDETLRVARAVRERSDVPIVLFGYYNPLFVRGEEEAARVVAAAGVDALLVVDLPVDESMPLRTAAAARGLGLVPLVAPTTLPERVARIGALGERFPVPFVYYVSMTGVTGGAGGSAVLASAGAEAARVRAATKRPTVVGFGIDSGERARIAATEADGVVVGSEIVRRIERGATHGERLASVRELVRELRAAV